MKKRHYSIVLAISLIWLLLTGVALAAESTPIDGKEYYKTVYNEYKDKPLAVEAQSLLSAPIGSAIIDMKLEGFAKDAKVCKMTVDVALQMAHKKDQTKFKVISYIEQEPKDVIIYHYMDKKWTKQKRENVQLFNVEPNNVEDNLQVIKSVEVLQHTPEITELKINFDFNMVKDIVKKTIDTDNVNFKNQKERDEALKTYESLIPYLNKVQVLETVDNKNKTLTNTIDFTDIIKDAVNAVVSTMPEITANERKEIEDFLQDSKAVVSIRAKILKKAAIIKVPTVAKKLAEEIKPATIKVEVETK